MELNAVMWGIGEMGIDNFRLLINAIKKSKITAINFENNSFSTEMAKGISELKLTKLNLGACNIGDEGIIEIVNSLHGLEYFDARANYITNKGAYAMVKALPKIKAFGIGYGNDISCEMLQQVDAAHTTFTVFDAYSCNYSLQALSEIVGLLPPNCALKLGPQHWVGGVNNNNDALPLNQ